MFLDSEEMSARIYRRRFVDVFLLHGIVRIFQSPTRRRSPIRPRLEDNRRHLDKTRTSSSATKSSQGAFFRSRMVADVGSVHYICYVQDDANGRLSAYLPMWLSTPHVGGHDPAACFEAGVFERCGCPLEVGVVAGRLKLVCPQTSA